LKTALTIFTALVLSILAGCNGAAGEKELVAGEKEWLTVDFQEAQSLRYRFVCSRDIEVDWGLIKSVSRPGRHKVDKSTESMSMVVAYTPIEVDPYGLTTIKATCTSVRINRSPSKGKGRRAAGKDAVKSLSGKTFTFTVNAAGKIEDYSQLEQLIQEIGKKAFRPKSQRGKIKEPDMISDFIATQWFLWDSVSSIELEKAIKGVGVGQSWKSKLPVPNPMVIRRARDVVYALKEIRPTENGQLAVIHSSYSHSPGKSVPRDWPNPYSGSGKFQMSGMFGFLRRYKVLELQGQGEELFNIDAGRIEQYNQQYQMKVEAALPMGLGQNPQITIKQNLTMELLGSQ